MLTVRWKIVRFKESNNNWNITVTTELDLKFMYAEIWWSIKVVWSDYSLSLCLELNKLFTSMFSNILVENFGMSKKKCGYLNNYGFAVCFKEKFKKE